ncbi:MAG: YbaK/EbsC family protein [Nitrospira sp.]|nr:YbaK/EbsC family protein [Nitrospira sp.]MDH4304797.1 YbaK/EbsC family protein [Nitrospira sp.]MDH5194233.1 YbaK/EbsC family protein [Nitrospira sp.]
MPIPRTLKSRLDREHVHYDILNHSQTERARAVAEALRLPEQSMVKVVIVKVKDRFVTMVLPATTKIDFQRLRGIFGTHRVRLATEDELARLFPDCEVGAMPPLGTLYGLPVYVDRSLIGDEEIVFEGGTHSEAIRMRYWDFAALVFPVVAEFHQSSSATC